MSDLKNKFLAELDDIENQKQKLIAEREKIEAEQKSLVEQVVALEKSKIDADIKIADAGGVDKVEEMKANYNDLVNAAKDELNSLKSKRFELIQWENRLVEIENRQKKEKDQLTQDQLALDQDKKTYKEKLKAEFIEVLHQQLPQ
jgi:hypothetical protein